MRSFEPAGFQKGGSWSSFQDVPASQGMAHGSILPEPIPEQEAEWLEADAK